MATQDQVTQTRKAYMAGFLTHHEYYSWLAYEVGFTQSRLAYMAARIKQSTDEHFNDIPLRQWDALHFHPPGLAWSLSDSVCVAKSVARDIRGHYGNVMTAQFKTGQTYTTRSVCDHDCIISVTVDKRTAKTVTAIVRGKQKTFRVGVYDNAEFIKPWGSYSMAPIVKAI